MNITVRIDGRTVLTSQSRAEAERFAKAMARGNRESKVEIVTVERIRLGQE